MISFGTEDVSPSVFENLVGTLLTLNRDGKIIDIRPNTHNRKAIEKLSKMQKVLLETGDQDA